MEKKVGVYKNILVPTDFSEVCDNALNQSIQVVSKYEGTVIVLHVSDEADAAEKLKAYLDTKEYANIVPVVKSGDIFKTINEVAKDENVDLIMMATHGKRGLQKLVGSYALKVIDSTKIPVIVVQDKFFEKGFKTIVFPVSLADEDRQKTSYAIHLAKMFDSKIHIFPRYESTKGGEKQMVNAILQIKQYLNKFEVDFEVAPLLQNSDNFQKKIINYSKDIDANLILIVSDPSNHLPLLGAKEENLLFNDLKVPVMVIDDNRAKKATFSTAG